MSERLEDEILVIKGDTVYKSTYLSLCLYLYLRLFVHAHATRVCCGTSPPLRVTVDVAKMIASAIVGAIRWTNGLLQGTSEYNLCRLHRFSLAHRTAVFSWCHWSSASVTLAADQTAYNEAGETMTCKAKPSGQPASLFDSLHDYQPTALWPPPTRRRLCNRSVSFCKQDIKLRTRKRTLTKLGRQGVTL